MKPDASRPLALTIAMTLILALACNALPDLGQGADIPTPLPALPTEPPQPTEIPTEPPAEPVQLDPCSLLSEGDVGTVLGGAVQAQPAMGTGGCTYVLQSDDPSQMVQVVLSAAQGDEAKAFTVLSMVLLAGFSGDPEMQAKFEAVNNQLPDLTLQETVARLSELFQGSGVDMVEADGPDGHAVWLVYSIATYSQGTLILVRDDTYVSLTQIGGDMGAAYDKLGELGNTVFDRLPAAFYVMDEEGTGDFSFSIGGEEAETPTAPPEPTLTPEPTELPTEGCVPVPLTPADGGTLDNGCTNHSDPMTWEFTWSACPASQDYGIYVIGSNATIPAIDDHTASTSYLRESTGYVANQNRSLWRWKVRAMQNGVWGDWSREILFEVEPVNTDCGAGN